MIRTLGLVPFKSSYNPQASEEYRRTQLDGGAGLYKSGPKNTFVTVSVLFRCTREGYRYLRAFYRTATQHGSLPLYLQMVFPLSTLTLHKAVFVPQSLQPQDTNGNRFIVAAQFIVESIQQ